MKKSNHNALIEPKLRCRRKTIMRDEAYLMDDEENLEGDELEGEDLEEGAEDEEEDMEGFGDEDDDDDTM